MVESIEESPGVVSGPETAMQRISEARWGVGQAWEKFGGEDGSRVNIKQIRQVLLAELAYQRALRDEDEQPGQTENLLARATRLNSSDGQLAADIFFGQALQTKLELSAAAQATGNLDPVLEKQIVGNDAACKLIDGLLAHRRI